MKIFVVFLATIGLSFGASIPTIPGNMCQAYQEYESLLPINKLKELVMDYFTNDPEVRKIFLYLGDMDILEARIAFVRIPEVDDILSWLRLNYYCGQENNWELIPVPQISLRFRSVTTPGGWKAFVDEYLTVYPVKKVKAWAVAKLAEGGQVAQLYYQIQDIRDVLFKSVELPAIAKVINKFRSLGVDVDQIADMIKQIFGW